MSKPCGGSAETVLSHLARQGLEMSTRLKEGRRVLVAKPAKNVTADAREIISSHRSELLDLVRVREVETEIRQSAEAFQVLRKTLDAAGLTMRPVLIHDEQERHRIYDAGNLPLTADEADQLVSGSRPLIVATARVMLRFRGAAVVCRGPTGSGRSCARPPEG